jgi:hypothetical protein
MKIFKIICVILFFSFLTADILLADSMSCGNRLVSTGDTKAKVLIRCGEPILKEVVGEKSVYRKFFGLWIGSSTVIVEKWTYDLGYGKFLRILTFEGDKLVKIEKGDKP